MFYSSRCRPFGDVQPPTLSSHVRNDICGWLPRCKHKVMIWHLVGCSRLSGLLMQSV